jgi:hypothetical protein
MLWPPGRVLFSILSTVCTGARHTMRLLGADSPAAAAAATHLGRRAQVLAQAPVVGGELLFSPRMEIPRN